MLLNALLPFLLSLKNDDAVLTEGVFTVISSLLIVPPRRLLEYLEYLAEFTPELILLMSLPTVKVLFMFPSSSLYGFH